MCNKGRDVPRDDDCNAKFYKEALFYENRYSLVFIGKLN